MQYIELIYLLLLINITMRPRYSLVELQIIHKWLCKYPSNYQEGFRKAIVEIQETLG